MTVAPPPPPAALLAQARGKLLNGLRATVLAAPLGGGAVRVRLVGG